MSCKEMELFIRRKVTRKSSQSELRCGSGYVGLVVAACFAEIGHTVISVDNDASKIAELRQRTVPIYEHFLPELLQRHYPSKLSFTTSLRDAVAESEAIFIAVGTPALENGEADLSYVEQAAKEIADSINGYKVIVEKSTVPVSTSDSITAVLLRNGSGESCLMSFPIQNSCVRVRESPTFCIQTES